MPSARIAGVTAFLGLFLCLPAFGGDVSFTQVPTAARQADKTAITFAVSAPTDVEVAVVNKDGAVVRHLAAGVLGGDNAPPEPLKPGRSQSIVWDGKDDLGKPVAEAPLTVRVRAGMTMKFGRFIGQDPYIFGGVDSLVTGDDGNLYVTGFSGPANECQKTLRVFSPEGKFLKTLLPFPADLPADAMKEVARWDEQAQTWRPRNLSNLNPDFYESSNGYGLYKVLQASKQQGVLFVGSAGKLYRIGPDGGIPGPAFLVAGKRAWPSDKEWPKADEIAQALGYHQGPVRYGISPDGKWLYLSGPFPTKDRATPKIPPGAIWRMRLDGEDTRMTTFAVVAPGPDGGWGKEGRKNYDSSGPVHGIAVDQKGNVYVCDRDKDRVVVFDEGGKEIGEIAAKNPDAVAIHPATGAIYVIRRFCNGWNTHSMVLDKFAGYGKDAQPAASFAKFHRNNWPQLAVAVNGERTLLWFAGVTTDEAKLATHERPPKLFVLEDKGSEFQPVDLAFGPRPDGQADFARIATDPLREEIYVSNGENLIYRYQGDTGEGGLLKKDGKPFFAPDLAVGYDGLLYVRSGQAYSGPLERLTRDLTPVPFAGTGTNKLYDIYGRYGIGFCEKGVGVGPDGKVYDCWMYDFAKYFVSGWGPDGMPLAGKYMVDRLKSSKPVWTEVKLPEPRKVASAIIGPVLSEDGGIRVDLKGNIYLGLRVLPEGFTPPAGFEKDPAYASFTGSVVKFRPEGGAVLAANLPDAKSEDPKAPRLPTSKAGTVIEGALMMYPGVAPFSGAGFGGNTSCCVCRVSRFDLDRYGRLALPNVVSTSVTVVDNAGNVICRFGRYGNFDSQYAPPGIADGKPIVATPDIPLCWPTGAGFTEKAIYVCDTYNRRVVRADMTWKSQQTCPIK
jgi:DNA-binding beta-propeller fold protein YncE